MLMMTMKASIRNLQCTDMLCTYTLSLYGNNNIMMKKLPYSKPVVLVVLCIFVTRTNCNLLIMAL